MNHPLVKKEWKSLKWVMLLYSGIFALSALIFSNNMAKEKSYHLLGQYHSGIFVEQLYGSNRLMVPSLLISILLLVGVLFAHDRNSRVGKFMNSLPYTRKEQYKIKYLMGLSTFTVPLLFFAAALYTIRGRHLSWISRVYQYSSLGELLKAQDSVRVLLLWLVFLWLIMVATYSFLMMVQTLIGQNIVASIIGGIVFLVPLFLAYAVPANLWLLSIADFHYSGKLEKWAQIFLLGSPEFKFVGNISVLSNYNFFNTYTNIYGGYTYQWFPLYMAILVISIIINALLGRYFIQHYDVEKNGEIALYPWVGRLLVIGTTVCSLLLLPIIIAIFTGIESPVVTLISMVTGTALGYFISHKSIEMTIKHG